MSVEATTTTDKKRQGKPLPPAAPGARFVAREQLAGLTGIPVSTWATWASRAPDWADSKPPMTKLGNRALYELDRVYEWIESNVARQTAKAGA